MDLTDGTYPQPFLIEHPRPLAGSSYWEVIRSLHCVSIDENGVSGSDVKSFCSCYSNQNFELEPISKPACDLDPENPSGGGRELFSQRMRH